MTAHGAGRALVAWLRAHPALSCALCSGLAALVVLLVYSPVYRPGVMHVGMLNDQVGYITTARWWAETGEFRSHTVIPAFLRTPNWRLYMPGHFASLAVSQLLFGAGPLQWRLPNMVAYVLTAILVCDIGRRLHGPRVGLCAAALVVLLPLNVGLAFTAMSGPTFMSACVVSFWVLLTLPCRWRLTAMPLLLAGPFLFREQGALLVVPMGLVSIAGVERRRLLKLLLAGAASVAVLSALYAWQTASGKQAPPFSWLLGTSNLPGEGVVNYGDVTAVAPEASVGEWVSALWTNSLRNVAQVRIQVSEIAESWAFQTVVLVCAFVVLSLYGAWRSRRSREGLYPLGAGAMGLLAVLVVLVFHKSDENVAFKHVVFTFPFLAVAVSRLATSAFEAVSLRLGRVPTAGFLLVLVAAGLFGFDRTVRRIADESLPKQAPMATGYLESLGHDDETLLVCPTTFGLDYVLKHYPVRWSFPPTNDETLRELGERFVIGTLILPYNSAARFTEEALSDVGLEHVAEVRFRDTAGVHSFALFRRPD